MVMQVMRHGRFSGLIKFFFLALLALGTFGLVLSDVSGTMTGGSVGGNNVAAVGGEKISLISFDRTVNRTLSRIGMSPQEAYSLGYVNQLLQQEMQGQALQLAARDVGIEVGRDQIAKQAAKIVEPVAGEKGNKQEALEQILRAQGMTEGEFIAQVGREAATALLVNAVTGALAEPSKGLVEDLYMHENESRDIEMIAFPHTDFKLEREPDEAALKTAYEGLKENFATPETRDIRILVLDDAALKDKVEIAEADIRAVYDEDKNAFVVQETRKVEQVIVKDKDQAAKIAESAKGGKSLKEATKEITGDEKAYLGDMDLEKSATQAELRAVAFEGKELDKVLGPVETPLGHHVMIVRKITPPAMKPFASVKEGIQKDLLEAKIADQLYEVSTALDDMLASGAAFEEIKAQIPLKITEIKGLSQTGQDATGRDALTESFKDDAGKLVQAAFGLLEGEASPVETLTDGRFAAVQVQAITPKVYKPYEEVAAALKEQWVATEKASQNRAQIKIMEEKLKKGEATLSSLSEELKKPIKALAGLKKTTENPEEPLIRSTLGFVFLAKEGEAFVLDIKDGHALAVVTKTALAKAPDEKALEEAKKKLAEQEKNEMLNAFTTRAMEDHGASINEGLLRQIYGRPLDDVQYEDTSAGFF